MHIEPPAYTMVRRGQQHVPNRNDRVSAWRNLHVINQAAIVEVLDRFGHRKVLDVLVDVSISHLVTRTPPRRQLVYKVRG